MPILISLIIGLFSGSFFKFFPIIAFLIMLIPTFWCVSKKRYRYGVLTFCLSLCTFFYSIVSENKPSETFTFEGRVVSKAGNHYLFKTIEGKTFRVYSSHMLEEGDFFQITCEKSRKYQNPYFIPQKENLCYVKWVKRMDKLQLGFFEKLRERINLKLRESLSNVLANVLIAMTTGERREIPREIWNDFQKTGLVHLLSISGAHFSLLFTFLLLIFRLPVRLIPYKFLVYLTLYLTPLQIAIIFCIPGILFYFFLVEPNYPTTRAFIMALFFMVGVLAERKSKWIISTSIACLLILLFDPFALKDLSFQLSFLATIAIGFSVDLYRDVKEKIKNRAISYIFLSLLISLSASFVTAPLVSYYFHYLSVIAPISNLTVGLLIGMILFPLNIIFVGIYLITGVYPFPSIIESIGSLSFMFMHKIASLDFASISVPPVSLGSILLFYGGFFLLLLSYYNVGLKRRFAMVLSGALIFISLFSSIILNYIEKSSIKVTFLDVGQADAAIIEAKDEVFVIDTGKTGFEVERFLKAKGYKEITALIITHEQKDHAGGFLRILENFRIKEIWDNGYINYNLVLPIKVRHLERGDILESKNCKFTILHPYRGFYVSSLEKGSNEVSLILKVTCGGMDYIFTADTGKKALESIPEKYLRGEVLKVPHHGSKHSFSEFFYREVFRNDRGLCVISVGRNSYGHPSQELIHFIELFCKIYRTDLDGAIQITERPDGRVSVKTFAATKLKPYEEWKNLKKLFILW